MMEVTMRVAALPGVVPVEQPLDFAAVYARWFHDVSHWARALGGPEADCEDLAQEVFLIVRRKLSDFDGRNLAGWLYRITARTVRDHRRRACCAGWCGPTRWCGWPTPRPTTSCAS